MKKILSIVIILFLIIINLGCSKDNKMESVDYSNYSFTDTSWKRDNGHDIETIMFDSNGEFHYSCACGNPVNDSDLCENYTYDDNKKEIKLNCFEKTSNTITNIIIKDYSDDKLTLDFNGDIRVFDKYIDEQEELE